MGEGLRKGFDLAKGAAIAFAGALVMDKLGQAISQGLGIRIIAGRGLAATRASTERPAILPLRRNAGGPVARGDGPGPAKLTKVAGGAEQRKALGTFAQRWAISVRDANGNVRKARGDPARSSRWLRPAGQRCRTARWQPTCSAARATRCCRSCRAGRAGSRTRGGLRQAGHCAVR